ncbi:MAG: CerR family C-terminal domain-containing protein [Pseudomonadota bacterium]
MVENVSMDDRVEDPAVNGSTEVSETVGKIDGRSEATRQALLDAAVKLFGEKGYENSTVRDLISEADVNLAAINYHFGGKEGLRYAAIDHIACKIQTEGPSEALRDLSPSDIATMTADDARATLRRVMKASFIRSTREHGNEMKARYVPRYIQRELIQGGKPTEIFFEKIFSVQFALMRALVARVTGEDPASETVRLRAVSLVGQSVFLNLARPLVLMALEWEDYTEEKAEAVADAFWLFHEG